ncbi:MAG TPA: hypothetical protein PLP57_09945 [Candidatus Saccharicenans sp.]|nr:hypothetical protein [Candidatus Saccharicenans sp.]
MPEVRIKKKITREMDKTGLELLVRQIGKPLFFPLRIIVETDKGSFVEILIIENQEETFHLQFPGQLKRIKVNPGHQVPGQVEIK